MQVSPRFHRVLYRFFLRVFISSTGPLLGFYRASRAEANGGPVNCGEDGESGEDKV